MKGLTGEITYFRVSEIEADKTEHVTVLQNELEKLYWHCEQLKEENQLMRVQVSAKETDINR